MWPPKATTPTTAATVAGATAACVKCSSETATFNPTLVVVRIISKSSSPVQQAGAGRNRSQPRCCNRTVLPSRAPITSGDQRKIVVACSPAPSRSMTDAGPHLRKVPLGEASPRGRVHIFLSPPFRMPERMLRVDAPRDHRCDSTGRSGSCPKSIATQAVHAPGSPASPSEVAEKQSVLDCLLASRRSNT